MKTIKKSTSIMKLNNQNILKVSILGVPESCALISILDSQYFDSP